MKTTGKVFLLICGTLFFSGMALAANLTIGELKPGVYQATPINHHTPEFFKNIKDYRKSLQKIELEIGGVQQFKNLPQLGMKNPYTGYIVLGEGQKFGVIVDVFGEEKRLYIDTDGDGSFAGEPMTLLINEWQGLQIYWVVGPEPLQLQVRFQGRTYPIEVSVSGLLNKPGLLVKEKPYLLLQVKTWFLGKIDEDGYSKAIAIVDKNNNGRYNDPEDQLFIDYNDDLRFEDEEVLKRSKGIKLKRGQTVDWGPYPGQIIVGGEK